MPTNQLDVVPGFEQVSVGERRNHFGRRALEKRKEGSAGKPSDCLVVVYLFRWFVHFDFLFAGHTA